MRTDRPALALRAVAVLAASAALLSGCAGDGDPGEAETGVPLNVGTADPAASPTAEFP
ncbi:hypothetical protein [Aquipuribacter nitratireducens]|uniref:Uncharacterized protein n=1 Tax=Aquipuribacter nitratireducens TaxID=650104 RepID=A0ABW0GIP3_9MICO